MNQWFVYQVEGAHVGPVTTDLLVRGVAAGRVPRDAHIAKAGSGDWMPLLAIDEVVTALAAVGDTASMPSDPLGMLSVAPATAPPPLAPPSEAEPTEVIRRSQLEEAGGPPHASSSIPPQPPKTPTPGRTSNPPLLRPSGSMKAIAPSKPQVAVAAPVPPPPQTNPMPVASAPLSGAPLMPLPLPPSMPGAAGGSGAPLPLPVPAAFAAAPPSSFAPPPAATPAAEPAHPAGASAPPDAPKDAPQTDAPKAPAVDPRTAFLLPFGVFAVFAFLSLVVLIFALVTKPHPASAESSEPASDVTPP